ncbi:MAG: MoaD/ThiS family protein [bacterium]
MTVRVRLPRALAEHAGGQGDVAVDFGADATVDDVIAALGARYPAVGRRIVDETGALRRHVNVYVGHEECRRLQGLATPVPEGEEVWVIGSIAGG